MHQTSTIGPPRSRNSRQARKLRRDHPRFRGPIRTTSSTANGSAGDIEIRPRYHSGSPSHDVVTSTVTAAAHTHSTAAEIGHEAQPSHRQAHPVAVARRSV